MVVLSDKRVIDNMRKRNVALEKECSRLRVLLEVAREHLRRSPAPDAQVVLATLNGIVDPPKIATTT